MPQVEAPFDGIALDIPTASLDGLAPQSLQFNKRGSLVKKREQQLDGTLGMDSSTEQDSTGVIVRPRDNQHAKRTSSLRSQQCSLPSRAISADEDMLSRRVRLMYEKGDENVSDSEVAKSMARENGTLWEEPGATGTENGRSGPSIDTADTKSISSIGADNVKKEKDANELSGGIEYWKNVEAADVDRYGFIRSTPNAPDGAEPNPLQRVTSSLHLVSESPRRKRSVRPPSALGSNRSLTGRPPTRERSNNSVRPTSSQSAYASPLKRSTSRFRSATNHLPHNRDRKLKDEAADMLTLPPTAEESGPDTPAARAMRKKEWEREDKWMKMAKPTQRSQGGGGMTFEFDTHSTKLIERTWKGIPDRWRASAWYAFLDASAKRHKDSPTEKELLEVFDELQNVSSPDDVQIDIDVPRTITSHIMFRRRYRGGQRLLFRVLHAMSLYFPDTGYVQGMAALAATLLAYYDEEHAFIMLVRLWQLRGLEKLYRFGFSGLMDALGDFEREWLSGGEVATTLVGFAEYVI